jgi:hypothetical protein
MTIEQFRIRVSTHLKRNNIAPTAFGRKVMGDPAWVHRLLSGSEPKERTRNLVIKAMKDWPNV